VKRVFLKVSQSIKVKFKNSVTDEDGSISLLIIGLFVVTVATLLVITNIASIAIAQRSLVQASEAAVQHSVQYLDLKSYYVGEGGMLSGILNNNETSIPIECSSARAAINDELMHWNTSNDSLLRKEIRDIWLSEFNCDGVSVGISTSAFAVLPLQIPFMNLKHVVSINILLSMLRLKQKRQRLKILLNQIN
jgi:hypothetical protein